MSELDKYAEFKIIIIIAPWKVNGKFRCTINLIIYRRRFPFRNLFLDFIYRVGLRHPSL